MGGEGEGEGVIIGGARTWGLDAVMYIYSIDTLYIYIHA